jgi:hypothetical protein
MFGDYIVSANDGLGIHMIVIPIYATQTLGDKLVNIF